MIISTNEEVKYINKAGLIFFGFDSYDTFKKEHKHSIDSLFIEEEGYINKYTFGKKWLKKITEKSAKIRNNTIKVKLYSHIDEMEQYFQMRIKKLNNSEYLLSFWNINDIELEKKSLQDKADLDLLTQIYSRVKFNDVFPQAINRALTYNETFSLILFDIDHFKMINDTLGHAIGDKVLRELARSVNMQINKRDIFARWGGEEFIVLSRLSTGKDAYQIAEKLRKHIEGQNFGNSLRITCSFGVTQFIASDSERGIFQRVDNALYEAKDAGRNQVILR